MATIQDAGCAGAPGRPRRIALPFLALMTAALSPGAEDLRTRLERGLEAARRGDCQAALVDLRAAVAVEPRLAPAHNSIGVCLAQGGHPEAALASFLEVTKLEPGAWQSWKNLGANYLALDRPPEAFQAFDRAQRLAPRNPEIVTAWLDTAGRLASRAADLIEQKQYGKARTLLLLVGRPLESSGSWNNLLGYAEFKLGHAEAASRRLEKALQLEPDNEDYLLDIGEFLAFHRAYAKAAEFFEVAALRMPGSPRVRFGLAVARILQNRRPEATAALEKLLAEQPRFEAVYRALGECYEDAANWTGMIDLGKRLQAVNPANAVGWYLEGAALERMAVEGQGSPLAAVEALKRAVEREPDSSRYHFTLGKAYREAGQYKPAVAELEETVRIEPRHERAHYVLGQLYRQLGQTELARAELKTHSQIKAKDREQVYGALLKSERSDSSAPADRSRR